MTHFLLGAILAVGIAAVAEGYVIFGRMQLFLTAAEQILAALQIPLRDVPTKSARRTVAPADLTPRRWFQALRRLVDADVAGFPPSHEVTKPDTDDELARWEDDGGTPAADDDQPTTQPMRRIDLAAGARVRYQRTPGRDLVAQVPAQPDPAEADPWRARFTFSDDGRRAAATRTGTGGHTP